MTISAAFTFSGVATPLAKKSVAAATSFTATIDDLSGVSSVEWAIIGTDGATEIGDYTAVASGPKGSIYTITSLTAFTGGIVQATVRNGDFVDVKRALFYVPSTGSGLEPLMFNEWFEGDSAAAYVAKMNAATLAFDGAVGFNPTQDPTTIGPALSRLVLGTGTSTLTTEDFEVDANTWFTETAGDETHTVGNDLTVTVDNDFALGATGAIGFIADEFAVSAQSGISLSAATVPAVNETGKVKLKADAAVEINGVVASYERVAKGNGTTLEAGKVNELTGTAWTLPALSGVADGESVWVVHSLSTGTITRGSTDTINAGSGHTTDTTYAVTDQQSGIRFQKVNSAWRATMTRSANAASGGGGGSSIANGGAALALDASGNLDGTSIVYAAIEASSYIDLHALGVATLRGDTGTDVGDSSSPTGIDGSSVDISGVTSLTETVGSASRTVTASGSNRTETYGGTVAKVIGSSTVTESASGSIRVESGAYPRYWHAGNAVGGQAGLGQARLSAAVDGARWDLAYDAAVAIGLVGNAGGVSAMEIASGSTSFDILKGGVRRLRITANGIAGGLATASGPGAQAFGDVLTVASGNYSWASGYDVETTNTCGVSMGSYITNDAVAAVLIGENLTTHSAAANATQLGYTQTVGANSPFITLLGCYIYAGANNTGAFVCGHSAALEAGRAGAFQHSSGCTGYAGSGWIDMTRECNAAPAAVQTVAGAAFFPEWYSYGVYEIEITANTHNSAKYARAKIVIGVKCAIADLTLDTPDTIYSNLAAQGWSVAITEEASGELRVTFDPGTDIVRACATIRWRRSGADYAITEA